MIVPSYVCFSVFFFFQAEDGIRDIGVTGVQTCALPISVLLDELHPDQVDDAREPPAQPGRQGADGREDAQLGLHLLEAAEEVGAGAVRSEERRVGKECRSRWSPYH